jgi:hypothetical protein
MNNSKPCKRSNGSTRAYFRTREEAEAFAADPANHPVYLGDVVHLCFKGCGFYHLSKPEWLFPEWETLQENAVVN